MHINVRAFNVANPSWFIRPCAGRRFDGSLFPLPNGGQLLEVEYETGHPRWMRVAELARLIKDVPEQFSWVDQAGLEFYLKYQ